MTRLRLPSPAPCRKDRRRSRASTAGQIVGGTGLLAEPDCWCDKNSRAGGQRDARTEKFLTQNPLDASCSQR